MTEHRLALVVGATRGIGLGVTKEFLQRGWDVIATARDPAKATALQDLAAAHPGRVSVPRLDMNDPAALDGFPETLGPKVLDAILVNAGVAGPEHRSADAATATEIGELMFTNAIAPVRLARALASRIRPGSGVLAFTSSAMGSVADNPGGHELYRASKAALNSLSPRVVGRTERPEADNGIGAPRLGADGDGGIECSGLGGGERGGDRLGDREAKREHRIASSDYTGKEVPW